MGLRDGAGVVDCAIPFKPDVVLLDLLMMRMHAVDVPMAQRGAT
jgi:hypothetical protein